MGPDVRWVGTESGRGRTMEWSVVPRENLDQNAIAANSQKEVLAQPTGDMMGQDLGSRAVIAKAKSLVWYPAEIDVSIRPGWFYHETEDHKVKTAKELMNIYFTSVGMNGVLLLNIPPNREGKLSEKDVESLHAFRRLYDETFTHNLLSKAKEMGFKLRIHADEIESIGGVDVAAELGATSAEHLMMATDEGIRKMAEAKVIGNLLPATTFSLMEDTYAPARKMLEAGMAITLTTDSNPGSCPTANLQFVMQLGCFMMRLTPVEVLNAVTINAAYSVNRQDKIGSFDTGKQADITILDAKNIDYPLYFFATNLTHQVYKAGKLVVDQGRIV